MTDALILSGVCGAVAGSSSALVATALLTWRDRRWQAHATQAIRDTAQSLKSIASELRELRDRDALIDRLTRSLDEARGNTVTAKIDAAEAEELAAQRRKDEANKRMGHPPAMPGVDVDELWVSTQPQQ